MGCGNSAPARSEKSARTGSKGLAEGSARSEVNPYKSMVVGRQRPLASMYDSMSIPGPALPAQGLPEPYSPHNLLGSTVFAVSQQASFLKGKGIEGEEDAEDGEAGLQEGQGQQMADSAMSKGCNESLRSLHASTIELRPI